MNVATTFSEIGRRQAEVRKFLGLTQADMAARIGVPMRTLSDNERGISVAGGRVLAAYCTLGIRSDWLLTGQGKPFSNETPQHIQDMIEAADEGQIALAHFETSDIRESYLVTSDERRHLSRVSLNQELCADFCGTSDLGLPDSLRLFTIEDHQGGILIVDAGRTRADHGGFFALILSGRISARHVQSIGEEQVAIMQALNTSRIDQIRQTNDLTAVGAIVGSLSGSDAQS